MNGLIRWKGLPNIKRHFHDKKERKVHVE